MKKTIILAFFALLSLKQYAQIEKGTYVPSISINANYSGNPESDTVSSNKQYSWSSTISLGFGKFIKDNLLLSGSFSYNHSYSKRDYIYNKNPMDNDGTSSYGNTESIGIQIARYKFLTENFAIRYGAALSVNYNEGISRNYDYNGLIYSQGNSYQVFETKSFYSNTISGSLNLLAGIQYFISKNLALTGNMGFFSVSDNYSPYLKKRQINEHTLTFGLTPSFNAFSVGLMYYFRPKNTK